MANKRKNTIIIISSILAGLALIPLIKAKPEPELTGDIISTKFERVR